MGCWLLFHLRRAAEPVLPPALFSNPVFNIASVVMMLTFMGLMGASVFFPLFFQLVMGVSPAHSGMMTVAMMIGLVISSMLDGRVLLRSAKYKKVQLAGLSMAVVSFVVLAWAIDSGRGYLALEPAIFTLGAGLALVMPNMTIVVQNALPQSQRGIGTAMLTFFRSLGVVEGKSVTIARVILSIRGQAATQQQFFQPF